MNKEGINYIIRELDDDWSRDKKGPIYTSCIGRKIVPYIGWFWIDVDFERDHCWLGILPITDCDDAIGESNDSPKVGFMENNKWYYDEFKVDGNEWKTLKQLIIVAVEEKRPYCFEAVDVYMQSLLPEKHR